MNTTPRRPLLLVDVDGPLNPYDSKTWRHNDESAGYTFHTLLGYKVALNPRHGEWLNSLTDVVDLVWATTWEEHANELLSPLLGLPQLPVIPFAQDAHLPQRLCWKTETVLDWIAEHDSPPFAWLDDDVSRHDRKWAANDHRVGAHLIRRVEAHVGLTETDITAVREWATSL